MNKWKTAAITLRDKLEFPKDTKFKTEFLGETHGKGKHQLAHYFNKSVLQGFELLCEFARCNHPDCRSIRWKRAIIFNNEKNQCYIKWFIRKGKPTNQHGRFVGGESGVYTNALGL